MSTLVSTPFTAASTASHILDGVDLTGRTAIVTGGASGLGVATVRALAEAGAQVASVTRSDAENPLDLSDLQSVKAFVQAWDRPLDIVVANAGVMAVPTRRVTAEGWELQLATNFLGHFALINGLHERKLLSPGARIAVVSSGIQRQAPFDFEDPHFERRPYDPWAAYAQSKVADVLLAVGITRHWAGEGITANAQSPGYVHTNLQRHLDEATMRSLGAMDEAGNLVTPSYYKTPEQGAATSVLIVASPLLEGFGGRYFEDNQELPVVAADAEGPGVATWSVDPEAAERLWDLALATVEKA